MAAPRFRPIQSSHNFTVLQVLPELHTGGVERGTVEIAGAIVRAGGRAIVASAGGSMESELAYVGAQHIHLPLKTKSPIKLYENAERIDRLIKREKIDLVHARSRAPAWSAWLAAKRRKTHFVTTFHGVYGLEFKLKRKYNAIMTKGERVIAISDFVREHILANYEVEPNKVEVIHRGVDLAKFSPDLLKPMRVAQLAHDWHLPEDDTPIIMLPGRITRWKGQDVLIRALAKLQHREFVCLLVGEEGGHPDYADELTALVAELGLYGRVRMVGNTPLMAEAYKLATVIVAPSTSPEAFGRVPIEAQAMGKPVIATRHGGAMETVREFETGWLVDPSNVDQLAAAIDEALSLDPETLGVIERNARWNAAEHFSSQTMCDKTIDLYRRVLSGQ